ncbi:hypothetical protein JCM10908_005360 [Rhodotorula pacifica]|uniref:uncharacterized protein n=1 Tax=Rhodotorula pacifica TaxID=1495444 RepID=UPI0031801A02
MTNPMRRSGAPSPTVFLTNGTAESAITTAAQAWQSALAAQRSYEARPPGSDAPFEYREHWERRRNDFQRYVDEARGTLLRVIMASDREARREAYVRAYLQVGRLNQTLLDVYLPAHERLRLQSELAGAQGLLTLLTPIYYRDQQNAASLSHRYAKHLGNNDWRRTRPLLGVRRDRRSLLRYTSAAIPASRSVLSRAQLLLIGVTRAAGSFSRLLNASIIAMMLWGLICTELAHAAELRPRTSRTNTSSEASSPFGSLRFMDSTSATDTSLLLNSSALPLSSPPAKNRSTMSPSAGRSNQASTVLTNGAADSAIRAATRALESALKSERTWEQQRPSRRSPPAAMVMWERRSADLRAVVIRCEWTLNSVVERSDSEARREAYNQAYYHVRALEQQQQQTPALHPVHAGLDSELAAYAASLPHRYAKHLGGEWQRRIYRPEVGASRRLR